MIIYSNSVRNFIKDSESNTLIKNIKEGFFTQLGYRPGIKEVISWHSSLYLVYAIINRKQKWLENQLLIEFQIPHIRSRIDLIFTGKNKQKEDTILVVELKQWTKVGVDNSDIFNVITSVGNKNSLLHPSVQAQNYVDSITNVDKTFLKDCKLKPCVLMHNYEPLKQNDPIFDPKFKNILKNAPVFTREKTPEFVKFIDDNIAGGKLKDIVARFNAMKFRPSKKLIGEANQEMDDLKKLVLSYTQKETFEIIKKSIASHLDDETKTLHIVKGAAGTGKTIVALLAFLHFRYNHKNLETTIHLPGTDFRKTIETIFNWKAKQMIYGAIAGTVPREGTDIAIIDEAHLIDKRFAFNNTKNYIKEFLQNKKNVVIIMDDNQITSCKKFGTIQTVKEYAESYFNTSVYVHELQEQFRVNGGQQYISWIKNWLYGNDNGQEFFKNTKDFAIKIYKDPMKMYNDLKRKQDIDSESSRFLSTYCWPWTKDFSDDGIPTPDIDLGNLKLSWYPKTDNFKNTKAKLKKGYKKFVSKHSFNFNTDKKGIDYVGFYQTVQGSEFDHVAVYIGEDIYFNTNTNTFRADSSKSKAPNKYFKLDSNDDDYIWKKKENEKFIKNQLNILLTRARKSVSVYFKDPNANILSEKIIN